MEIDRTKYGDTHEEIATFLNNLALLKIAIGETRVAAKLFDQVVAIFTAPANRDRLKLNTEFVILSACNAAAGQSGESESLSGLARAFFYALAKSLLVSQWLVNSQAAVRLTINMFATLEQTPELGRTKAMQLSMLAMIDDRKSQLWQLEPGYWAAFCLMGKGAS